MVTRPESPGAVPAVPEASGVRSSVRVRSAGASMPGTGSVASTSHTLTAGSGSGTPAGLIARACSSWRPSPRPAIVCGEEHGSQAAPSRRHSKVLPGFVEYRRTPASIWFVGVVRGVSRSRVVSGAGEATVNAVCDQPEFPAQSSCDADAVYSPSGSGGASAVQAPPEAISPRTYWWTPSPQ